ncbi:uncharacterized protein [Dermacentor albipictus]|uniref:uncharacterized protein isoform X8 n=1 Tax=Dermacentor albipictus TaxID=60249 RepID=UPI0038FC79BD
MPATAWKPLLTASDKAARSRGLLLNTAAGVRRNRSEIGFPRRAPKFTRPHYVTAGETISFHEASLMASTNNLGVGEAGVYSRSSGLWTMRLSADPQEVDNCFVYADTNEQFRPQDSAWRRPSADFMPTTTISRR